ncbi:MAG: hypothetical protein ABI813_14445 [Bacteroidota bacterium]
MDFKKPVIRCLLLPVMLAGTLFSFSCKKAIEQQQKNIIVDAMTHGRWYVEQYTQDAIDITPGFLDYEFQFYENGQVDGIKTIFIKSGTWSADIGNYTITAAFPADASDTLKLLNHTWKITDSYLDYVEAKTTTASGENTLHLRKK